MLIRFSVENYLSFKDKVVLDLEAASIKEYPENLFYSSHNKESTLLKSAGIFGPNSSGKTNIIRAAAFMKNFILNSSKESLALKNLPIEPFRLSTSSEDLPSTFEIVFFLEKFKYRYGFSLTSKAIESEWLFITEKRKEEKLFVRAKQNFSFEKKFSAGLKGKFELVNEMTRSNTLFISVLAQFNHTLCLMISNWFSKMLIAHDTEHIALVDFTAKLMATGEYRKLINDVIKKSDLGIESIEEKLQETARQKNYSYEFLSSVFGDDEKQYSVKTSHFKYKENMKYEKIYFDLITNESLGTQKFFGILGPLLYTIKEKGIIWIDEIDARMHSILLQDVIGLFNSKKTNANGAQLIFTSHNTNILRKGLRRDQIMLTEKDKYGVSTMESLHSKRIGIRNDATFEKDYLTGKYGAIPGLGSQLDLFGNI